MAAKIEFGCSLPYFCRKLSPVLLDVFVECLGGKAKACSLGLWTSESEFVGRAGWEISTVSLS